MPRSKVGCMRDSQERAREDRLRRIAHRHGLMLKKSRQRNPDSVDYGNYWLIEISINGIIQGGQHGASLDEIDAYLARR